MGTKEFKPATFGKYRCVYQLGGTYQVYIGEEYLGLIRAAKADLSEETLDAEADRIRARRKRVELDRFLHTQRKQVDEATKDAIGKLFADHPERDLIVEMVFTRW